MYKFFFESKSSIFVNLAFIICSTYFCTEFNFTEKIFSQKSWGASLHSSSTYITAFATFRPWWIEYTPEVLKANSAGGVDPIIRIQRSEIKSHELSLPRRSIGYYAFCGFIVKLRSLFSEYVIYDFALIARLQQILLVIALAVIPLSFYFIHKEFSLPKTFTIFSLAYVVLFIVRPNNNEFLVEGIIDSALAAPLAIFSVSAFWILLKNIDIKSKKNFFYILFSSLFFSYCSLVRGEFLFIFLFVYFFLFITTWKIKQELKGLAVSLIILFSLPTAYGLFNKHVFGHFVPLRMQSGQNLYEPIGQYPNPYGIEYNDEKIGEYLKSNKIKYVSFEADEFLTKKYLEILKNNPKLFVMNLYKRLHYFSLRFSFLINFWTLPLILIGLIIYSIKDALFRFISIPLVIAIGYLFFFGWINSLFRLVSPVHFLINIFICSLNTYLIVPIRWKHFIIFVEHCKRRFILVRKVTWI